jgi:hypothetical protein
LKAPVHLLDVTIAMELDSRKEAGLLPIAAKRILLPAWRPAELPSGSDA